MVPNSSSRYRLLFRLATQFSTIFYTYDFQPGWDLHGHFFKAQVLKLPYPGSSNISFQNSMEGEIMIKTTSDKKNWLQTVAQIWFTEWSHHHYFQPYSNRVIVIILKHTNKFKITSDIYLFKTRVSSCKYLSTSAFFCLLNLNCMRICKGLFKRTDAQS